MSRIFKIVEGLVKLAYEHDPNLLKNHEQEAKEKFKNLDSNTNDAEELRNTYHEKIRELAHKPVTPEDMANLLKIFEQKETEEEIIKDNIVKEEKPKE